MGRTSDAKTRLIEAATELMYARGYTAVGVQEICAQAGVKKGSFYHFFPSKQALGLAVIDAYGQHTQRMWEEAMASTRSPLERMQRVFDIAYEIHRALVDTGGQMYGCPIGNFALELSGQDEIIRQKLRQTLAGWTRIVERMLHEATANGDFPALDVGTTARTIVAYFEGVLLLAKTHNDPGLVRQLAQGAVHLVEAAANGRLYKNH